MRNPVQRRILIVGVLCALGPGHPGPLRADGLGHVAIALGKCRFTATPGELITNGSVEQLTGSYGPTGWQRLGTGQERATCDDQRAASGVRSLKLAKLDGRPVGEWRQRLTAPAAGTRLRLRAAVCAQLGPGSAVVVTCSGMGAPNPRLEIVRDDIGPEWTFIEAEAAVNEHVSGLTVGAALKGTGTAWFDDFSLSPIVDGAVPTTTDLDVLLPLPPSCGRQALLAARLGIRPNPPVAAVSPEHGAAGRRALRVHLEQVKGEYEFGWTALLLLGSTGVGAEVLDGPIRPVEDTPEALRPFANTEAVTVPDVPEAQQQLALLNQAQSYSDVVSLSRDITRGLPGAPRGALAWRTKTQMLLGHPLTATMFRMRKVPARVVRLVPLLVTRGPEATNSYEANEVYVPGTGWVPLPSPTQGPNPPSSSVLDVLPPGELEPKGLAAPRWTWRPVRLVYGRPSPTAGLEFGWAAFPLSTFPLTQGELSGLAPAIAPRWQASMDEITAGAPPTTYNTLFARLRDVKSADELAAALAE